MTARGLTTSPIPYGARTFQIDFDFIDHQLTIDDQRWRARSLPLQPRSPSPIFTARSWAGLRALGLEVRIWTMPVEIADADPVRQDRVHAAYDADVGNRFWRILVQADRFSPHFRSRSSAR